jgi:putative lipoic acid-binding regulatory protein
LTPSVNTGRCSVNQTSSAVVASRASVNARSQEQLDAIYREVTSHEDVLVAL